MFLSVNITEINLCLFPASLLNRAFTVGTPPNPVELVVASLSIIVITNFCDHVAPFLHGP